MTHPREMAKITTRLVDIEEEVVRLTAEKELLWDRVFSIADDLGGTLSEYRYLDPAQKKVVGRIIANPKARIEPARLEELLTDAQWILATKQERVYDANRLEAAVAAKKIPAEKVAEATHTPDPQPRRNFRDASKKDLAELAKGGS